MANFEKAFARLIDEEGLKLSNNPADRGKQTYGGISRKFHLNWAGWRFIDAGGVPPLDLVREFYRNEYWSLIRGEQITSQRVAEVLFSQCVNNEEAGIKLMQMVAGVIPDGKVGPKTVAAINLASERLQLPSEECVLMLYSMAHSKRYHAIGMKDTTQRTFWPGWWARAMRICK